MNALLDSILEYSKVGKGKHRLSTVDLADFLSQQVDIVDDGSRVQAHIDAKVQTIKVKKDPLGVIIRNMIANSIKHSNKELVTVRISAEEDDESVHIIFEDDGVGVPAEYTETIFEMFKTLETRAKVEGSGMGLAIVKKLVEHEGGRVWAESPPSEPTKFHLTWPCRKEG